MPSERIKIYVLNKGNIASSNKKGTFIARHVQARGASKNFEHR